MKSITEVFAEEGALSRLIPGFQYRREQEAMAKTIFAAVEKGEDLICEAGTGTGKTMAYLVPALLAKRKTIISTGTRHLQDQLKQKDLPLVLEALALPVTTMVLKGRANYLCLERLQMATNGTVSLNQRQLTELQTVIDWGIGTITGDINELSTLAESSSIKSLVTSTTENCLGQTCPKFDDCFVFKNRKAALEADVVITNHHLLLADMDLRENGFGEVLPLADVMIFDEAHQLPELASVYFSKSLGSRQLLELVTDVRQAIYQEAKDSADPMPILGAVERQIRDLRLLFGRGDRRLSWQAVLEDTALSTELPKLLVVYQSLLELLEPIIARGKKLDHCYQRAKQHYDYIETYSAINDETIIRWLELKGQHFYFNSTPVDIAETFQRRLASYDASHVFTSASLAMDNDFSHFSRQLGLEKVETCIWNSPFDYERQTRLYLPIDLPDPNQPDFFERFIERVIELVSYSKGHAFILFTSHAALARAAKPLKEAIDYPFFVQGSAPRAQLLNQFRQTKHAVLLGTSSFWEGVDVKGDALLLVIIEKLPFASPDDPVLQARLNHLKKQGVNPFLNYQVPQAAIALKQGVGRLIRDCHDRGVCVICDKRIIRKGYGKQFIKALPPMPISHDMATVQSFFEVSSRFDDSLQ